MSSKIMFCCHDGRQSPVRKNEWAISTVNAFYVSSLIPSRLFSISFARTPMSIHVQLLSLIMHNSYS